MDKTTKSAMNQCRIFKATEIQNSQWQELSILTKLSFAERVESGLHMYPNHITPNGVKKLAQDCLICVATDIQARIIGYIIFNIQNDINKILRADIRIASTHPETKRQGIGRMLFKEVESYAEKVGCIYITSDTSEKATSSIKWHKQMGFIVNGHTHFEHTNYFSIKFKKYINNTKTPLRERFRKYLSWIKCRLIWQEDGQPTLFRRLQQHIFHKKTNKENYQQLSHQQVQKICYDLLVEFTSFCEKHGLRYLLCYGTLLGAVRHKGFIPWDDDIDVTMPLPDYERFLQIFPHENNKSHIRACTGTRNSIAIPFTMLQDCRTTTHINSRDAEHSRPVCIDIFPAYPLSDNPEKAASQIKSIWLATRKCYCTHRIKRRNPLKYIYLLLFANRILSNNLKRIKELCSLHAWGSTQRVRIYSLDEVDTLALPHHCFDDYELCPFENIMCRIPRCYDSHLSELYGDYMTPPPLDKRTAVLAECHWISPTEAPENLH